MAEPDGEPLLLRAARAEPLERPPVWLMRQAGRYMRAYRELRDRYPDFRQRSEDPAIATEISLQPWRAFAPDGVILFSDILTPLPGIGIPFTIAEGQGPVVDPPIRTREQIQRLHALDPETSLPFIRQILQALRQEVGNRAAVLGFVGAPWTLAAYAIEGQTSKHYTHIKGMAFSQPELLHAFLAQLADAIAVYVRYQIESGAQLVQLFDSWAGTLSPADYEAFALPYQQRVVRQVKATHPQTPLILYVSGSAGVLDRLPRSGVDVVSLDWHVDMAEARARLGDVPVQGNLDPGVLFGSQATVRDRALETIRKAGTQGHIFNLGHGVLPGTPEENVACLFETAKQAHRSALRA